MPLPYEVTAIEEQYALNGAGHLEKMMVVHYKTALGDTGTVSMSKDQYNADAAKALIEMDVAEHAKLRGIK